MRAWADPGMWWELVPKHDLLGRQLVVCVLEKGIFCWGQVVKVSCFIIEEIKPCSIDRWNFNWTVVQMDDKSLDVGHHFFFDAFRKGSRLKCNPQLFQAKSLHTWYCNYNDITVTCAQNNTFVSKRGCISHVNKHHRGYMGWVLACLFVLASIRHFPQTLSPLACLL